MKSNAGLLTLVYFVFCEIVPCDEGRLKLACVIIK